MPSLSAETAQQMAEEYDFTEEKLGYVAELLSEEYAELWGDVPSPGDIIFFDWAHNGSAVYPTEGNANDTVM